jgi:hypothetical protein
MRPRQACIGLSEKELFALSEKVCIATAPQRAAAAPLPAAPASVEAPAAAPAPPAAVEAPGTSVSAGAFAPVWRAVDAMVT